MEYLWENKDIILVALLSVSEALALIPAFKGNGILDSIINVLKSLVKK